MNKDQTQKPKVWVVRALGGKWMNDFLTQGCVAVNYHLSEVDMSSVGTRDEIKEIYRKVHPNASVGSVANVASQLDSFLLKMQPDDYIITPALNRTFYYGTVADVAPLFKKGASLPNRRNVHWTKDPLQRHDLPSLAWNIQNTIFEVKGTDRNGTNRRNEFFKLVGRDDLVENVS